MSEKIGTKFHWGGGIEDTFVPQHREHLRALDEYELTQHYSQWREDIDRAAQLGIDGLRWGVPWFKVETQPGVYDWSWVDQVIDHMVNTRKITPVIDLVHYGTPLWMQDSFADPAYPKHIALFAKEFAKRYGKLVRYYTPANEPTVNADFSGRRAEWPPYLADDAGYVKVLLAISRGIQRTVKAVREVQPDAEFIAVEAMHAFLPASAAAAPEARLAFLQDMLSFDLVTGAVDENHPLFAWLKTNGASCSELEALRDNSVQYDVCGVNFYPWSTIEVSLDNAGKAIQRTVPSNGLRLADVLRQVHAHTKLSLVVSETSADGSIAQRLQWMNETMAAARSVRDENIPVNGYCWFPLITMIGWEYRRSDRPIHEHLLHLGLWDSHFDDAGKLVRRETPLVNIFRERIREGIIDNATHQSRCQETKMGSKRTRVERDSMGDMRVPADAYFGASTQRAVLNFPISDLRLQASFIRALALIKHGAAVVNMQHGKLPRRTARAISRAALEVASGKLADQFVVDVFQTGSGTSTNMNMNEVITNRAVELLGGKRGDRRLVHPNDHVNAGMSSNDAIPTATHIAALLELNEKLLPALVELHGELAYQAREFAGVIKTGRTHLQDATPITLGQEFSGYAAQVANAAERLYQVRDRLSVVALGGTAVGTGVNARADFASSVLAVVSQKTGLSLQETPNHFQAQSTLDEVAHCSSVLRTLALSLSKIANDIRWLGSGPRAGLGELTLPEVQPGSSIMPGKVNPVIAESLLQVVAQVVGNDATIAFAAQSGNFELNVMQPVAAFNLLQSINLLASACVNFARQCIGGLKATGRGPQSVETGLALGTALVPAIGYDAAAAITKEAVATGKTVFEVAKARTNLSEEQLKTLLDPFKMTSPDAAPRLRLGITGGIACGKNAVGDELRRLGVWVIDTDDLNAELMSGPNPAYDAVLARFGSDIVTAPGQAIDRKRLGKIVFADEKARRDLEAIMHPAINALMDERMQAVRPGTVTAALVPLLFEAGMENRFDEVWTVYVSEAVQLERLMKRNGLTEEQARARIAAQLSQAEKVKRAKRVIDNSGTLSATNAQVKRRLAAAKRKAKLA